MVVDTDVMVAAIRSDAGASRKLLEGALTGKFTMLASTTLLIEYETVMTRQKHLDASGLAEADVIALIDAVAAVARPVKFTFHWRLQLNDPDDDMVLETAINGGADAIVTFNTKDFESVARRFGIDTWKPGQAVRQLEA